MKKATTTVENPIQQEAMRYLEDQAYVALLGYEEPVRSAEIIGAIGKDQYSAKLVRHVLSSSPRFTQIDRRWDLEVRYEDKQRPMERVLAEIITQYGRPITVEQMARELAGIYERPAEYYETIVARMLGDEERYFRTSDGLYGSADWLLRMTSDTEEDVIFDNELDEQEIERLAKAGAKIDWSADDPAGQAQALAAAAKTPVGNKYVGFFLWKALGDVFDPVAAFEKQIKEPKLVWLSDARWTTSGVTKEYDSALIETADRLAEEVVEEAPKAAEKIEKAEEAAPTPSLTISDRDLDEVAQIISSKGQAGMPLILETIFELSPRDPIYSVAAVGLSEAMRGDARFVWLGSERWRMADSIPDYVSVIPAELEIPTLSFETMDGEQLEVRLEDGGLEGGLAVEVHNPVVQDVGDQDPVPEKDTAKPANSARCVVARHHRKLGTFPLCQIPRSFFPQGPSLITVTLIDGEKKGDVWINRETGLIYDMGNWYPEGMPESGAVYDLDKTEKPDEFTFVYSDKTDPLAHVAESRIQELLELGEEAKKSDLSTLELVQRLMSYHRKGLAYVTLFTEVNLVRRTTRRLVASILSSYYCFVQRPKSDLWYLDEKKIDQGFKKAKRKYVRK